MNPMRLEQRIGRVDRIGQKHDTVWIWSYFLEDTIEAEVYRRLMDRIDWFQYVVGSLQPILHKSRKPFGNWPWNPSRPAMVRMTKALTSITTAITQTEQEGIDFDRTSPNPHHQLSNHHQQPRKNWNSSSQLPPRLGRRFTSHPSITDAYQVTFAKQTTPGDFLHSRRQRKIRHPPPAYLRRCPVRRIAERSDTTNRYQFWSSPGGNPTTGSASGRMVSNPERRTCPITLLSELIEALKVKTNGSENVEQAHSGFTAQIDKETDRQRKRRKNIADEKQSLFMAQGQHLLTQAAYNWTAQRRSLFDKQPTPIGPSTLDAMSKTEGHPGHRYAY